MELVLVKSAIRDISNNARISEDYFVEFNKEVIALHKKNLARRDKCGNSTLMGKHA